MNALPHFIILIAMAVLVSCWHFKRISDFSNRWNSFSRYICNKVYAIGTDLEQNTLTFQNGREIRYLAYYFSRCRCFHKQAFYLLLGWNSTEQNIVRHLRLLSKILLQHVNNTVRPLLMTMFINWLQRKTGYITRHKLLTIFACVVHLNYS